MLLDDFVCNVRILTVLHLSWDKSNADVAPRNFHALSFRVTGSAVHTVSKTSICARSNDILYVPKDVGYNVQAQSEELYVIHFEMPDKVHNSMELFQISNSAKARKLFEDCYKIWTEKKPGYYFKSLSLFYNIMGLISLSTSNVPAGNTDERLRKAMDYLHSNYTDPSLSVIELCNVAKLSDTWFRRIFIGCYGVNPRKYINMLRIDYAKELIESGYYKVEEIAVIAGFENTKYFSTVFRQFTGMSPSQYMKQNY